MSRRRGKGENGLREDPDFTARSLHVLDAGIATAAGHSFAENLPIDFTFHMRDLLLSLSQARLPYETKGLKLEHAKASRRCCISVVDKEKEGTRGACRSSMK